MPEMLMEHEELEEEAKELTQEQKDKIDLALHLSNIIDADNNDCIRVEWEAAKPGRVILPYLYEKFDEGFCSPFTLSKFLSHLGEIEDLPKATELFIDPRVCQLADRSSTSNISRLLFRLIYEIRSTGADGTILQDTISKLMAAKEDYWGNETQKLMFLQVMAVAGYEGFGRLLEEAHLRHNNNLEESYEDFTKFPDYYLKRETLADPENYHGITIRDYAEILGDYEETIKSGIARAPEGRRFERVLRESEEEIPEVAEPPTPEEARELEIAARVAEFVKNSGNIEETARDAISLSLFNFLKEFPEASDEEMAGKIRQSILDREKIYSEIDIIPTIGIEIEIPIEAVGPKLGVLNLIGVKNEKESRKLWEVNPYFSYASWTQGRIIEELAKMGCLPLETDENIPGLGKVNDTLSMHINFGFTDNERQYLHDLYNSDKIRTAVRLINDILNYAFTSSDRIKNRKTSDSANVKYDTAESKKSRKVSDGSWSGRKDVRLELRAGEFRDYTTYRLLAEAQILMTAVRANIKLQEEGEGMDPNRRQLLETLRDLWLEFSIRAGDIIERFAKGELNLFDEAKGEKAIQIMEKTDIVKVSRELVDHYALAIKLELKKYYPELI